MRSFGQPLVVRTLSHGAVKSHPGPHPFFFTMIVHDLGSRMVDWAHGNMSTLPVQKRHK
jgi:hypothetical protein